MSLSKQYSIKDLENLSGIKAHTLRIWEQRYGILHPERTDTNIRYYTDDDLKRLLNISVLNHNGIKISHIAQMTDAEINDEVLSLTDSEPKYENQLEILNICMVEMDEERFEKVLSANILRLGFEQTMVHIIFPFLERVGILWMTGSITPAQEHFISNMIRQKLIVAIDGQVQANASHDRTYLLFCPEGEFHELGLLFMNYLVRSRQCRSVYLGASVPLKDLETVYEAHQPTYLFCYITSTPVGKRLQDYINTLAEHFPKAEILVAGKRFTERNFNYPANVHYIPDVVRAIAQIEQRYIPSRASS